MGGRKELEGMEEEVEGRVEEGVREEGERDWRRAAVGPL